MGRNEVSVFVCNVSGWGHMGRNRVSPLEMGTKGRGRVSDVPTCEDAEIGGEREKVDGSWGKGKGQTVKIRL